MLSFLIRRLCAMVLLLIGISVLVFFLMYLSPGDALSELRSRQDVPPKVVEQLEHQFGYTDAQGNPNPWYVRYAFWANTVSPVKFINDQSHFTWKLHFGAPSFGESVAYREPVLSLLYQRVPATIVLELCALVLAWVIAVPLGVIAAIKKDSWIDRLSAIFAYGGLSVPEYFLGLLAMILAAKSGWFPIGGLTSFDFDFLTPAERLGDYAHHLVLPTIVLSMGAVAGMMRVMRASTLDYLHAEFVTTARAKGLPEWRVLFLHVLRNAINPLITTFGLAIGSLLSGALLVEIALNYPGLGRLLYESLLRRDEYVVMAATLIGSVILVLGNLIADILLAISDPRIRLEKQGAETVAHRRGANAALFGALGVTIILCLGVYLLPWNDQDAMNRAVGWVKIVGAIGLLFAGGALLWVALPVLRKLLAVLPRQPFTALAAFVLTALGGGALFAPTLATQPIDQINLERTFHPPTHLSWHDGRLWAQLYKNVDPSAAQYEPEPGQFVPLNIFGRGYEYSFFGLFKTTRHLLVPDYAALNAQLGHRADPTQYPLYLLGSDSTGRDEFSRLLFGARISLTIGLVGIGITLVMGFLVGGLAGYFGGSFDFFAMRTVEFLMSMPTLYLLLALRTALAPYFGSAEIYLVIIIILSLIGWAGTARVLRGMSLSLRERPFISAAECLGQSTLKILFRHLLPNLAGYLLVSATLAIPGYILGEAALSYLGLGVQDPDASWGLMLSQAQDMKVMMLNFWWLLLPGAAIFITVMSFNILGDTLRDIVDPKMKTR
jgi:ABC-type dipeptide/oligopeptide/nickel transport system permease component